MLFRHVLKACRVRAWQPDRLGKAKTLENPSLGRLPPKFVSSSTSLAIVSVSEATALWQ
jgi:hypothetical protein